MDSKSVGGVYIPGIASSFDSVNDKDAARAIRSAATSKEVTETLKGFQRYQERKRSKASRTKIPFCLDMAMAAKKDLVDFNFKNVVHGSKDHRTLQLRIFICMCVGITFMLRKSEHIGSIDVRQIRKRDLTFFDNKNTIIKYQDVGKVQSHRLVINVEFSKTDQSGYGRRTQHYRQSGVDSACIVQNLENWIALVRDKYNATEDQGLYEVPGLQEFKVVDLHSAMATTAKRLGLNENHTSPTSHSLRYGGATMMAAAGYPQYLVAQYGGWTEDSQSLKIYTKLSEKMLKSVSKHMAEMSRIDVSSLFISDANIRVRPTKT